MQINRGVLYFLISFITVIYGNCPPNSLSPSPTFDEPFPSTSSVQDSSMIFETTSSLSVYPSPSVIYASSLSSFNPSVNAPPICLVPNSCKEWSDLGIKKSGVFPINPPFGSPFQVYCDMETNGGGWTVFQRRQDGSVNFNRNWTDYEEGFGDLDGEFWLGLAKIHRLTYNNSKVLRIELTDDKGNSSYAQYSAFNVANNSSYYMLTIGTYTGTAGDSLKTHNTLFKFITPDTNGSDIAARYNSGWWFSSCVHSNLNGPYNEREGIIWDGLKGRNLKGTIMKIK